MASTFDEHSKLLEEINRLQQEKRSLNVRVQGVEVLAKVLQDAQDENSKLKQEVLELKGELEGTSVDISLSLQNPPSMAHQGRCFLSKPEDDFSSISESSFEYVNCPSQGAPLTSGSFSHSDLHIEELRSGFRTMKNESDTLLEQAKNMLELIGKNVHVSDESADLASKVSSLIQRIGKHARDVKARETFLQGLVTEEEKLKEKFMDLESEQDSQKKVMEDLKVQLKDDKKELQDIREQIQFLCEAVVVNKEDASSIEYSSSEPTSSGSQISSLSTPSTRDKMLVEPGTTHACGQCPELMQQLQQVKREKEEAIRQKEEILDVNHAWDAQYKKLKAETGKEIADLKHQIDMVQNSDMWKSATAAIEQERQAKLQALQEKNKLEEKCRELEGKLDRLPLQEKYQLQQSPGSSSRMSFASSPTKNKQLSIRSQSAEEPPQDMIKEIEVLKQQLRVYADDFACERQDRERMQSEKEQLETEVRDLKEQVAVLKEQVFLYAEDFKKESQEKDRLRQQLNSQREGSDPEIRVSDMTRKAQAVAERQARLRALREQYNREERHLLQDQQELQQTARVMAIQSESPNTLHDVYMPRPSWPYRQDIHPRGPSEPQRSSSDMFHGGDVQADNRRMSHGQEVIDHASNDHCCPRCFRLFSRGDEKSYKKHTMKCIE